MATKMMEKKMTFKILTDLTADLPESWTQEHDVQVLGLTIQLMGKPTRPSDQMLTSEQLLLRSPASRLPADQCRPI